MSVDYAALTKAFENRSLDATAFRHVDHVAVAYEMLRRYDFLDAITRYAACIRTLAIEAGAPRKYNATITVAFMSLIAERMEAAPADGFDDFIARNPDLLSKTLIQERYTPERLQSDLARQVFLMPDAASTQ